MSAEDLLKLGDLDGALAALQDRVRAKPQDAKLRIFLFQLLTITGDWKRAITQLKLCAELDPLALPMAQTYREGIICEVYREKVFAGDKEPLILGEPPEWVALMINALKLLADGHPAQAAEVRARAFDLAPAVGGTLNGERFEWIADADMRLGPLLEVVVNGRYFWLPFAAIAEVKAEAPADLRDSVWTPVNIVLRNGGDVVGLIPTRYAGTTASADATLKLARRTEWVDVGADCFTGLGQRLLATDQGDTALMDLRHLVLNAPAEGGGDV